LAYTFEGVRQISDNCSLTKRHRIATIQSDIDFERTGQKMATKITIEIPDELYGSIRRYSNEQDAENLNKIINKILQAFISEGEKRKNDPLFSAIVAEGSGLTDVSQNHDSILYGA
jgi:hypothetical protein